MSGRTVRKQIVVSGRVQGVGFRYTASHAARMLGLTGWVRNDASGTVTMELQGEEDLIGQMASILEQGSWIRITEWKEKVIPLERDEYGFSVRR